MSESAEAFQKRPASSMTAEQLDQLAINTIRTLSIDAVQQANSGHPGTPMALAPLVPDVLARVAIEQASTLGWERYVGGAGRIIGMKTFGSSAPLKELQKKFGFEPERVVDVVREMLGKA